MINPELMKMARAAIRTKRAFQPPMPPDPSMGGGAGGPPPGAPPMDPAAMGGAGAPPPPMDPSMGGGAGGPIPGAGGLTADSIRQIMQEEIAKAMGGGGMPGATGGAGGMGGPGMGKPGKPDPLAQSMDIFQVKKMVFAIANAMGVEPPQDVMDGPNRDPSTGAPMPPGAPGSTSDPNAQAQGQQGKPQPMNPGAIPPLSGMQGALPSPKDGGGGEKAGQVIGTGIERSNPGKQVRNKAAAIAAILRRKAS